MSNLVGVLFDAADAARLRAKVAELEAALHARDATIATLRQELDRAKAKAEFYYGLHAEKPLAMIEDAWERG